MFEIIHGSISADKRVAYAVVYNEMFYLPAFLDHYRGIGIEQFIFIDDHSTDGSRDFLAAQPDTVIVRPQMRFGDKLNGKRAGPQWKTLFAHEYLLGRWTLCVDADEFLVLNSLHLNDILSRAEARGDVSLPAVMVDMYPAEMATLQGANAPTSFASMLHAYPCFDRGPYIDWREGALRPRVIFEGATARLLSEHGVARTQYSSLLVRLREFFSPGRSRSVFKVPLVKWQEGLKYLDSHTLNRPPSTVDGLALLHFKFTGSLRQKIDWAKERKSFSKASRGYFALEAMLAGAANRPGGLTYEGTCRYGSYRDLELAGIVPFGTHR